MKAESVTPWIKPALYIAGAFVGWKYVVSPILESVGLKDDKATARGEQLSQKHEAMPVSNDFWRPAYYKNKPSGYDSAYLMTGAWVDKAAKAIWNAESWYNTREEDIYNVFRGLNYKTQVSFLAEYFAKMYKKDLYFWLKETALDKDELGNVLTIVDKLPMGFVNSKTGKKI